MRVVGFHVEQADGPVVRGFLPLSDLTVLMGPNDVGKSRLAALLGSALERNPASRSAKWRLFARPTEGEAMDIAREIAAGPQSKRGDGFIFQTEGDIEARRVLSMDPLLGFEVAKGGADRWRVSSCLGHIQDGEVPAALLARDAETPAEGVPPTVYEKLGTTTAPVLPRPVALPRRPGEVKREVARSITDLVRHVSVVMEDYPKDIMALSPEFASDLLDFMLHGAGREPFTLETLKRACYVGQGAQTSISEEFVSAFRLVSAAANEFLPPFVKSRYSIEIAPTPILELTPDNAVQISLIDNEAARAYPMESVAEGLQLWIQLSVLEGADAVRIIHSAFDIGLFRLLNALNQLSNAISDSHDCADALSDADDLDDRSEDKLAELRHKLEDAETDEEQAYARATEIAGAYDQYLELATQDWAEHLLIPRGGRPKQSLPLFAALDASSSSTESFHSFRSVMYLIDEPERHLHPRLHRSAAQWLAELVRTTRAQALITTHSPAFLSLGEDISYVRISRDGSGNSELHPFSPDEIIALRDLATDIGLDRGQLLANTNVLLFVEGRADQALLEALFGPRLRSAGVIVAPISGAGRHGQIADSEILLRYLRCKVAVLFDSLTEEEVLKLKNNAEFLGEALRSKKTELNAMAQLFRNAIENDQDIEPMGHPADDIFDLLDEATLSGVFPRFPGHTAARAGWDADRKKHPNRKLYYEEKYGVLASDPAMYRWVGELMRDAGRFPPELSGIVDEVERLSLG